MSCLFLYVFDMFHILLSGGSLRDLWNVYMYVCVCVYVCSSRTQLLIYVVITCFHFSQSAVRAVLLKIIFKKLIFLTAERDFFKRNLSTAKNVLLRHDARKFRINSG